MINPGNNQLGSAQKVLAGVGWFSRELPRTPTKFPSKMLSCTSQATISKEREKAARSQEIMEIPAIISETLAALKP